MSLRILLADDEPRVRREVRLDLEESGFTVCAEVDDGPDAIAAAVTERPDVCLLDVAMPGDGIVAAQAIRQRVPTSRVVMLTASREQRDLLAAVRAGAVGYLLKDVDTKRLREAIEIVANPGVLLLPDVVPSVVAAFDFARPRRGPRRRANAPTLTDTEREVLELVRARRSTGEIAAALGMRTDDVRGHVERVIAKLAALV